MPSTVTSLNSGDCISSACDDDDHLPPTLTTTTPVAAEASSHKNDGAQRMHIKELFTKIFWGFHQFWGKWCIDMKLSPFHLSAASLYST